MPAPAFILAAPHCGASRLAAHLGRHPQLCALPELHLCLGERIGELLDYGELDRGLTLDGLLRALAQLHEQTQNQAAVQRARAWLRARREAPVDTLYREIQAAAGGLIVVVPDAQSPLRPLALARLRSMAPEARWLHLVRHPLTHGMEFARLLRERLFVPPDYLDHRSRPPQIEPQIPWLRGNRNLLEHAPVDDPVRYRLMRMEDCQTQPRSAFADLCRWLGIASDPAVLAQMEDPSGWPYWDYGPACAPLGLELEIYETRAAGRGPVPASARLDVPLPWRDDGTGFAPEVVELAARFGYR
jgi:hypothetical protein